MSTHIAFHSIQDFSLGSDPFEVRRHTHKIMQLLPYIDFSLKDGIHLLLSSYGEQYSHYYSFFYDFFLQRLTTYCQHLHILPELPKTSLNLYQIQQRHDYFQQESIALQQITHMHKRILKILAKHSMEGLSMTIALVDNFELLLYDQSIALQQMSFLKSLVHLQDFLYDIDLFFKHYFMNDPDLQIRSNRLMILKHINQSLVYLLSEAR